MNSTSWSKKGVTCVSSVDDLPQHERASYYRKQAQEALKQAASSADQLSREGLLRVAAAWHGLASELERFATFSTGEHAEETPESSQN